MEIVLVKILDWFDDDVDDGSIVNRFVIGYILGLNLDREKVEVFILNLVELVNFDSWDIRGLFKYLLNFIDGR